MAVVLPAVPTKPRWTNTGSCNVLCARKWQHEMSSDDICFHGASKVTTALPTPAPFPPAPGFSPSALAFFAKRRASSRSGIDRCWQKDAASGSASQKGCVAFPVHRRPSSVGMVGCPPSATVESASKQLHPSKTTRRLIVKRTVEGITEYLMEAGETAGNASFIVARMLGADNFLLDMDLGGIITIASIDEFRLKLKQEIRQTLLSNFPSDFKVHSSQQTMVIDRMFKTLPLKSLDVSEPHEDLYEDAVIHALYNDFGNSGGPVDTLKQVSLAIFRKKYMKQFPKWQLTHPQKMLVVDTMVDTLPISEIPTIEPQEALYLDSLIPTITSHPDEFKSIDVTLRHLFGAKFLTKFAKWTNRRKGERRHEEGELLTDLQKVAVVDRILKTLPISVLPTCEPEEFMYREALAYEASNGCLRCPVCLEPMVEQKADGSIDTSKMWFARPRKTEHWSNNPCGHACCRSCMSQWAETVINDQKSSVKCPVPGCSYRLWNQDLGELVTKTVLDHHKEHESANHLKVLVKLAKSSKTNEDLKSWLKANARPCPECHVIVSRYEGCNVMTCVCGTKFCYACGFKSCQCQTDEKSRPDIWKPRK